MIIYYGVYALLFGGNKGNNNKISADLFTHPKVREMFRKSREINQVHSYEVSR